ncbi:MAG: TerB family tellurite resistance protein [Ilumatobacteraceae bacterium]|nr:TerB family tellurite resistance protein [Acidimicrobiales bacterium]MCB9393056.1 TerB family tellurite resistance protein [Acidimicrobiaceae bacterium]
MSTQLKDLYDGISVHATADREHEAAIELLLLVMVADGHIGIAEIEEIRTISEDQGFESETFSFDQHLGLAMAKVRTAIANDEVDGLLDDIDHRITSSVLRQSLFSAARDVAGSDREIGPAEESLLAQVAARFA